MTEKTWNIDEATDDEDKQDRGKEGKHRLSQGDRAKSKEGRRQGDAEATQEETSQESESRVGRVSERAAQWQTDWTGDEWGNPLCEHFQ